jgi:hypothetical protein
MQDSAAPNLYPLEKRTRCRPCLGLGEDGLETLVLADNGLTDLSERIGGLKKLPDSILLSSRASEAPLMVYDRPSTLSRALYTGTQVLFCPAMTRGS